MNRRYTLLIPGCYGLVAFGSGIEALQIVCFGFFLGFKVKVSRWNHPVSPKGTQTYTSQYLNVRQRKLVTIISQTVHMTISFSRTVQSHAQGGMFAWATHPTFI
jgi:hypothetical protein